MANLTNELTCFDNNDEINPSGNEDQSVDFHIDSDIFNNESQLDTNEEGVDPHDADRTAANETVMISNCKYVLEGSDFCVAPGEGKTPISILDDDYIEELAHPHLLPTGKFGYKVQRDIPLSPVRYFNARLLNYTQKFASDTDYNSLHITSCS